MQSCTLHLETIAAKKFVVIVFPNFSRPVSRQWWPCTGACTSHWTVQKVSRRSLLPSLVSWSVRSEEGGISRYCGSTNNIRSVCVSVCLARISCWNETCVHLAYRFPSLCLVFCVITKPTRVTAPGHRGVSQLKQLFLRVVFLRCVRVVWCSSSSTNSNSSSSKRENCSVRELHRDA